MFVYICICVYTTKASVEKSEHERYETTRSLDLDNMFPARGFSPFADNIPLQFIISYRGGSNPLHTAALFQFISAPLNQAAYFESGRSKKSLLIYLLFFTKQTSSLLFPQIFICGKGN